MNKQGQRTLTDLGNLAGVPANAVIQAFDVRQAKNYDLYLALATKEDDRNAQLWVSKPFKLSDATSVSMYPKVPIGSIYSIRIVGCGSGAP